MEKDIRVEIAERFGRYLDQDDFVSFAALLDEHCEYEIGDQVLNSKASIAGLYEKNMTEGKIKFDELVWGESKVQQISADQYDVYFSDFIKHKGIEHNYKCKQRIWINANNLVEKIVHIELAGEKEALQKFYDQIGLG